MRTGKRQGFSGTGALLLALLLLFTACASAQAEENEKTDIDLLLARNAVDALDLKDTAGGKIVPRTAPEKIGFGEPDVTGEEPDYRGVVGYASIQTDWEVSRFTTFTDTPWILPLYERAGDEWKERPNAMIRHKTPVLVLDQFLREEKGHKFRGYLEAVRLDTMERVWISVINFVTVPYWTMELSEAVRHGYCIAVYRNRSRYEPLDRKAHRGFVPDGTRVLMCMKRSSRYFSKDPDHNPMLGIVFRSKDKSEAHRRIFLFFDLEDLTLIY